MLDIIELNLTGPVGVFLEASFQLSPNRLLLRAGFDYNHLAYHLHSPHSRSAFQIFLTLDDE
ncbi:hypothetical protein Hanom_Chr03g00268281 [Helianthus anomalus]